jgi:hypothetical protein
MATSTRTTKSKTTKKPIARKKPNQKSRSWIPTVTLRSLTMAAFIAIFGFIGAYYVLTSSATTNKINFAGKLTTKIATISHPVTLGSSGTITTTLTAASSSTANFTYKIKDSNGTLIVQKTGNSPLTLNASLPAGTYKLTVFAKVTQDTLFTLSGSIQTASTPMPAPAPAPTPPADATPPSAPSALKATGSTVSSITLSWAAATDAVGVTSYKLFRDSTVIATVNSTLSFTDTKLVANKPYNYTVVAYDAAGNASPLSNAAPAITKEGPPAPKASYKLDSSFDRPSKSNPTDYREHVDFNVVCKVSRVAPDDPIVFFGQPGASHIHVFAGNTAVNASSTLASLEAGSSNCLLDRDTASYWQPQLYSASGKALSPSHIRAYYRAGTLGTVSHIPQGLRMVAGDPHAMQLQSKSIAGWQCRHVSPDTIAIGKQAALPTCASKDLLEGSVVFPNCWDGVNLDAVDHRSHMAYGNGDSCDSAHPVRLPQLTLAYRYTPGQTNNKSYLSSMNSSLTLHADFFNAWNQTTLDQLVDRCINSGVHCGDLSPKHFPGGLN